MREKAMGLGFIMRKSEGVRVYYKKKSNGVRVKHKKDQWGETSPLERAMG